MDRVKRKRRTSGLLRTGPVLGVLGLVVLWTLWIVRAPDSPRPRTDAHRTAKGARDAPPKTRKPSPVTASRLSSTAALVPTEADHEGCVGIVVDPVGEPVAGVTVRHGENTARTDAYGRYWLSFSKTRVDVIHAHHPDVGVGESDRTVWGKPRNLVRIVLYPATRIRGRIVAGDGGELVNGVIAYRIFRGNRWWSGSTAVPAHGVFTSDPLNTRVRRQVVVKFTSASHYPAQLMVVLKPGQDADFGVMTVEPKPAPARITGRVVSEGGGIDLRGAVVVASSAMSSVEPNGTFEVGNLKPGAVQLVLRGAIDDGYRLLALGPSVELKSGGWVRDYVLLVRPAGSVRGLVLDHGGAPAVGVTIEARAENVVARGTGTTDAAGRFVIAGLLPGRYAVAAEDSGHGSMSPVFIDVKSGMNETETTLRLPSEDIVRGRIVDREQEPLVALRAELIRADGVHVPVVVEADGSFRFSRPEGRGHYLVVRARDRASATVLLFSREASRYPRGLSVSLDHGRAVQGTVVAPNGGPADGAVVRLLRRDGEPVGYREETRCDAQGRFVFLHTSTTGLTLRVTFPGAKFHRADLDRLDAPDLVVELRAAPGTAGR